MSKLKYTWEEFHKDAEHLASRIKGNNFEAILIITKGGLFLGSYLAEALNIPVIETIGIKSYESGERKALEIVKEADPNLPARLVIVDDIADSGETLKYVQDLYKAPTVTLFKKPQTVREPVFYEHEVANDVWVEFPWEILPD